MEAKYFTILYWFCHTSTWIHHGRTRVPHPEPTSHLPPHTMPPDHPSAPAPRILYWTWTGDSFLIWYYTCYHDIPPNHPTLSLSHRVQKTVLYIRFLNLYFYWPWILSHRESLPVPLTMLKRNLSMFSSHTYMIVFFTFRSLMPLEFLLVYNMRNGSNFIFFQMA